MICAARFYDVVSRKYGATVDVIGYELDGAAMSDFDFVHSFIERTGIDKDFYEGGLRRLKSGSAADQITDGLNKLSVAMRRSGVSIKLTAMARCSIVGYLIAKSPYGSRSQPLRGVDTFFSS
jgi:propanediol dehydratase large subunit